MYQVGEMIIYGGEGVCKVEAVGTLAMTGVKRDRQYYTLAPLYRPGRIYAPVDTAVFMRPILSKQEAEDLVKAIPDIEAASCTHRNPRILGEYYQEMMRTRSCDSMVRIIKMAHHKGQARRARGVKPGQVDERYLKRAEDMLYGELAASLGIPREEVVCYITKTAKGCPFKM